MNPKTFFRLSLLLPVLAPAVAFLIGPVNMLFGLLMFSLGFGGVAYIPFALVAFVSIGRLSSARSMQILSCFAPVLFFFFEAIFLLGICYLDMRPNFQLGGCLESMQPFAFYSAILGYGYVAIVNLAWWGSVWRGWVGEASGERDID